MGGAIGGMTLMNHPEYFARAVLTAPMIAPSSAPLPRWAGKLAADFMCAIGKREDRAFIGKPFSPENEPFETSCATSRVRFDYYERKRIDNAHLQNCSPTYGWVQEAIGVTKYCLTRQRTSRLPRRCCSAKRPWTRQSVCRSRNNSSRKSPVRNFPFIPRSTKSTCPRTM